MIGKSSAGKDSETNYVYKIVLVGDMGCGKSNILQRYHKGVFTRMASTIGVEFLTKRIVLPEHPVIKAQIWDTAGSERYRCITTGHYRQAVGALLVFDITERESFNNLDYWLTQLRDNSNDQVQICLMANKCDLANERQVSSEEIEEFVAREKLIYVGECSALSDTNIKQSFEALIRQVHVIQQVEVQKRMENSVKLSQKYHSGVTCGREQWCCSAV